MIISEHPQIKAQYALFLAAAKRLGAAVLAANSVFVGQHVQWRRRGKSVDGTIAAVPASTPWLVGVKVDAGAKLEWRSLDQVSLL